MGGALLCTCLDIGGDMHVSKATPYFHTSLLCYLRSCVYIPPAIHRWVEGLEWITGRKRHSVTSRHTLSCSPTPRAHLLPHSLIPASTPLRPLRISCAASIQVGSVRSFPLCRLALWRPLRQT